MNVGILSLGYQVSGSMWVPCLLLSPAFDGQLLFLIRKNGHEQMRKQTPHFIHAHYAKTVWLEREGS